MLVDRFLEDAIEIDVDALCDGAEVYIGGIMEHIEEAGIHSGDSACALPPVTLGRSDIEKVRRATEAIAHGIGVVGPAQRAVRAQGRRALRAGGQPAGQPHRAVRVQGHRDTAGQGLRANHAGRQHLPAARRGHAGGTGDGATRRPNAPIAVKEAVLPFHRFRRADGSAIDSLLGPEMKSTGEVMGIDRDFGTAFAKSQTAAYGSLPTEGTVFVSVANRDKRSLVFPVKRLADLGFRVLATEGTAEMLRRNGIPCDEVRKHFEQPQPGRPRLSAVDAIRAGEVDMVINTPYGNSGPRIDGYEIRSAAVAMNIPCVTTVQGASAAVQGIEAGIRGDIGVRSLQELHSALATAGASGDRVRRPAGRRDLAPRAAVPGHRPASRAAAGMGSARRPRTGWRAFCDICVEAFAGFAVVKPQVAFFEAYGAAGYAVLERTIAALREAGVLVLADAKRGDIGSTMAAYAAAWAGDSPLAADAVTASPYLGFGSLRPLLDTAAAHGRGVFVLAATSNPEGATVQRAGFDGRTVAQSIVDQAAAVNREPRPGARLGRRGRRRDGCRRARRQRAGRPGAGARRRGPGRAARGAGGPRRGRGRASCCPRCRARCCGPGPMSRRCGRPGSGCATRSPTSALDASSARHARHAATIP